MKYIKENAPSLLEDAEEKNRKRLNSEREKNSKSKEGKQTNASNKVLNHSQKDEDNSNQIHADSAGVDDNKSASIILNKIIIGWFL